VTDRQEHITMTLNAKPLARPPLGASALSAAALEILRRTAHYLATTPGGLRCLEGAPVGLQGLPRQPSQALNLQAVSTLND
jgi:hypothetical protein